MVISDDEEEERGVGVVPGSPTPSVATTFGGEEEEEEDVEHGGGGKARGMKRSVSVPVGRFGIGEARGKSVVVEGVEGRNKAVSCRFARWEREGADGEEQAIRKIVLARLTTRGVARDDERFKDVFAMTSKGVQFAFVRPLSPLPLFLTNVSIAARHFQDHSHRPHPRHDFRRLAPRDVCPRLACRVVQPRRQA